VFVYIVFCSTGYICIGLVFDDSTNENSVQVICNHVGTQTFKDSGEPRGMLEQSVQHGDLERGLESRNKDYVQVVSDHAETSTFEDSVGRIVSSQQCYLCQFDLEVSTFEDSVGRIVSSQQCYLCQFDLDEFEGKDTSQRWDLIQR
jgi:hypothetical protein